MRGQFYRGASLACTIIVVLAASCGERGESEAAWAIRAGVPPALQKIADRAEAIIRLAPSGDWPRVYAYSREIKDAWLDYKHPTISTWSARFRPPGAIFVQDLDAAVAALYDAQAARDLTRTLRAANDISESALDLFDYYHPTTPPDARRLAVLQRRVIMDVTAGDFNSASKGLGHLDQMWLRVKPTVQERTDAEVIRTLEDHIAAQHAALATGDWQDLATHARETLALIDLLQQSY